MARYVIALDAALQADAVVTLDAEPAAAVRNVVEVEPPDVLR